MKNLNINDKKTIIESLYPEKFDMDNDEHIDFIYSCHNIYCRNYKMPECEKFKFKMINEEIKPSIITTNAVISGIMSLQLYILCQIDKIDFLRDCTIDLSNNSIILKKPNEAIKH